MTAGGENPVPVGSPPAQPDRCPDEGELWRAIILEQRTDGLDSHLARCSVCRELADQIRSSEQTVTEAKLFLPDAKDDAPQRVDYGISGYRIIREVHRGSQGVVFEAEQGRTRRRVAVKMLLGGTYATTRQRARFSREIEAISGLSHPWIVTLYSSFVLPDGRCGYSMEYVEGLRLDQWWRGLAKNREGRERLVRLFVRICHAVQHAHMSGVIHRDLKPSNVLVVTGEDGFDSPKILDFGIARAVDEQSHFGSITVTGEFAGTPAYAAPEQVSGAMTADVRSDVHAIGIMLYEAVCGVLPYAVHGTPYEVAQRIACDEPTRPREHDQRLSRDLETIILRAIDKDPGRRYQSAAAFGEDLKRFLDGAPVSARRDSTFYVVRRYAARRKKTAGLLAIAVVAGAGFIVQLITTNRRLDAQKQELQAALDDSELVNARQLLGIDRINEAQEILWKLAARTGLPDATDPGRVYFGQSTQLRTLWALWESINRSACLWTVDMQSGDNSWHCYGLEMVGGDILRVYGEKQCVDIDVTTGRCLSATPVRVPPRQTGSVYSNAVNGRAAIVIDNEVRMYEVVTGRELTRRPIPAGTKVGALRLSRDGTFLAIHTDPGLISVFTASDLATTPLVDIRSWEKDGAYPPAEWSPTEDVFASCDPDGAVRMTDVRTARPVLSFRPDILTRTMKFSQDGKSIALTLDRGNGEIWDLSPLARRTTMQGGISDDARFVMSPSTRLCLTLYQRDGSIAVYDGFQGTRLGTLHGHKGNPNILLFPPDELVAYSADDRGSIKAWRLPPASTVTTVLPPSPATVHDIRVLPGGRLLVCGAASLWGVASQDGSGRWQAPAPRAGSTSLDDVWSQVCPIPNTDTVVTALQDPSRVVLRRVQDGARLTEFDPGFGRVNSVDVNPSGTTCIAAGMGGACCIDLATGAVSPLLLEKKLSYSVAKYSPDGSCFALAGTKLGVRIYDAADPTKSRNLETFERRTRSIVFSLDGSTVYAAGDHRAVTGWNVRTGERVFHFATTTDIFCIELHPLGSTMLVGERSGQLSLIDLRSGQFLARLANAGTAIFCARFIDDGRSIAYSTHDGRLEVLDIDWAMRRISAGPSRVPPATATEAR